MKQVLRYAVAVSEGVLAILGSGETAPGMTKIHRRLFKSIADLRAVNIDTSYGFQLNVPQMSQKLEEYFQTSLHVDVTTLHFPSFDNASEVERALFKRRVRESNYVFAGPGSPTYALAQWAPLHFEDDLQAVLGVGGTICISSAASLTLGAFTAPIYEIYKVGDLTPVWRPGLNVLGAFGLNCAVIPHFDNAEGRNYDTRYCYLGEPRLLELETQLPDDVATLGVDEHTAVTFDFATDELRVEGRSNAYWRHGTDVRVLANGSTLPLEDLRNAPTHRPADVSAAAVEADDSPLALADLAARGGPAGINAIARLVELASTGQVDRGAPTALIEGIIGARLDARAQGNFALADVLRDILVSSGVEVRDTPTGTDWTLPSSPR
jgi:hypothetical protein